MKSVVWCLGLALLATPALGHASPETTSTPAMSALIRCRQIGEPSQRLACFDREAAALDQAQSRGDVVVLDRAEVRETRRRLFGLSVEAFNVFDRGGEPERIDSITSSLQSVGRTGQGLWVLTLADGSVWRQVESERLRTDPRPGAPVTVRRASMGSFFMNVDGARAIRVTRDR